MLQGQDALFLLAFTLNEAEVNFSVYEQYYILAFDHSKKIVARFSREALAGYEIIDASDQVHGKIQIHLKHSVTQLLPNVQLYYVVLTQQEFGGEGFYSGSSTAQELVYIERSSLPIIP